MPLTVLYFAVHTTVILYYVPDCTIFYSPYHSDIILCPWLCCILQSIPQWYYTLPLTIVHCSPNHSDIVLCPWLYCILQSIPQWYYTMSLTVLYIAVHTTVILYYSPDCIVYCSQYHSDIILFPWLYCILESIPQWYYTIPLTVLYSPHHSDIIICPWLYCILQSIPVILYYAPDCTVFCSPYHIDIILCPWLYCILQSIPQWYYTMPLTVLYFAVHTTVILYYAPDCAVFCSPYHSDIILCPWLYCILQSISQWYYTMPLTVLYVAVHTTVILYYAPDCAYFAVHTTVILYYAPVLYSVFCSPYTTVILYYASDCTVFCSPYHSDLILCLWLYCILHSIPQWYYTMPLTVLYFAVHSTVILYYALDCAVFCSPYHSDIILCPWLCCILQSIPQWYYTIPLTVLYFAVHTTMILYYAPDCTVFCSQYHSDIILCPVCAVFCSP